MDTQNEAISLLDQIGFENEKGWSNCSSKEEYMAKLHYLRSGFYQGKIDLDEFNELEKKIVVSYWNKGS